MPESPRPYSPQTLAPLRCIECGVESDDAARGWRAYIGGGFEGEPRTVGTFCPACSEREFAPDAE